MRLPIFQLRLRGLRPFHAQRATELLNELVRTPATAVLKEHEALRVIGTFGVGVLQHHVHDVRDSLSDLPSKIPEVSVIKGVLRHKDGSLVTHKTEYKAIELNVPRSKAASVAEAFIERFAKTELTLEALMFREYVDYTPGFGNEILLSAYQDMLFGPCVVLSFGGVLVETYKKDLNLAPIVIPVGYGLDAFLPAIRESLVARMLLGETRGTPKALEWDTLVAVLRSLCQAIWHFSPYNPTAEFLVQEMEVNPAAVVKGRVLALDSVMTVSRRTEHTVMQHVRSSKPLHKIENLLQPRSVALLGCSESIEKRGYFESLARRVFRRFAQTKAAEDLFDRVLLKTLFAQNPANVKAAGSETASRASKPKPKKSKAKPAKTRGEGAPPSEATRPGVLGFLKRVLMAQRWNPCNFVLEQSLKAGLAVYPIHPRAPELLGRKCVRDISELKAANGGKPVDVLVVGIPAVDAVEVMKTAFDNHICESVQLFSAGFAETEAGRHLQTELVHALTALDADPTRRPLINGPNTVGNWVSGTSSFNTIFADDPRTHVTERTSTMPPVALLCQSGGFSVARLSSLSPALQVCMCVSVGNQMDLGVCDLLQNLLDHGPPKGTPIPVAIGIYLEGLTTPGDGLRLMTLVARARREQGMTVVVYKAGRSEEGQHAVATHTASMATDYAMFAGLLERSGAVMAPSLKEFNTLLATSALFGRQARELIMATTKPATAGVMAVTNSGFLKCGMADVIPKHDPTMQSRIVPSPLLESTKAEVRRVFADHKLTDVVEVNDILDVTPAMHVQGWKEIVSVLMNDPTPLAYIFAPVITPAMLPNPAALKSVFSAVHRTWPQ
eukprot:RCo050914